MNRGVRQIMVFLGLSLLTLTSGVLQGRWSNRWGTPADLKAAGERVTQLPEVFGEWRMIEESDMPAPALKILNCAGYVNRTYADSHGNRIGMAMYVGPPGPMSVHTPEVCYSSQNAKISGDRAKLKVNANQSFWVNTFVPNTVTASPFRVAYSWSPTGEKWTAVEVPRVEFGSERMLFKIQIVSNSRGGEKVDPAANFLSELLKILPNTLAIPSAT